MTYESTEKLEEKNELTEEVREEIRLIAERAEAIIKAIEGEKKEFQTVDKDSFYLSQIDFITQALKELITIVKNDQQIQSIVQAHSNLNHELGNFEVYTKLPAKIINLRNQFSNNEAEILLKNFKDKVSDFFNYMSDISKNFDVFKYNVTHANRYKEQRAA